MSEFSHEFGATPNGFKAVPADELMRVEGGLSWGGFVRFVRQVVRAADRLLNPKPVT